VRNTVSAASRASCQRPGFQSGQAAVDGGGPAALTGAVQQLRKRPVRPDGFRIGFNDLGQMLDGGGGFTRKDQGVGKPGADAAIAGPAGQPLLAAAPGELQSRLPGFRRGKGKRCINGGKE
jgi:hypothetical protein